MNISSVYIQERDKKSGLFKVKIAPEIWKDAVVYVSIEELLKILQDGTKIIVTNNAQLESIKKLFKNPWDINTFQEFYRLKKILIQN